MKNNIAFLRKNRAIPQKELAKRIGISHWWLNHIESGKRNPSINLIEKIAKELDVSKSEIFLD